MVVGRLTRWIATGFDTGPQFVFNFGGGPGVRVHQFGGARPRRRPRDPEQAQDASVTSTIMGLLPILLLFIFPLISSLFSGPAQPAAPHIVFDSPQPPQYTKERTIPDLGVKYYVDPNDIAQFSNYKLGQLDKTAEVTLVRQLRVECEREMLHQQRLRDAAQGWFFQDPDKMAMADNLKMPNCKRLMKLGRG
jgi:DnaJ family protein B protein 12